MKRTLKLFLRKISCMVAPVAFALAVMTVNATCWCFTYQPDVPHELNCYIK